MPTLLKHKSIIVGVVFFAVAGLLYNTFMSSDEGVVPTIVGSGTSTVGQDLLKLSVTLSKVTLNQELFSQPGYRILTDFSTEIPAQPVGRSNPFASIGKN